MQLNAAVFDRGIFIPSWGYFSKTEGTDEMAPADTEIKKAKAKEKAYSLNDSGGQSLWITPAGGRLWRWAYRFDRRETLMSLGKYPMVSLAMAGDFVADLPAAFRPFGKASSLDCRKRISHDYPSESLASPIEP